MAEMKETKKDQDVKDFTKDIQQYNLRAAMGSDSGNYEQNAETTSGSLSMERRAIK